MPNEEQVLKALSNIIDPDFQKDIVSLGFIKSLDIQGNTVSFTVELTTPACPIKDQFKEQAENVVMALDGVDSVNVTMSARKREPRKLSHGSGLTDIKNIIAVSSCKGGVGKSTIAAMIALNLSERGFKTGLLDADLFGPSVPTLFNMHKTGVEVTEQEYILPRQFEKLSIASFGFMLGDKPAVMRGPMASNYIQQLLHQVEWGELDYLIIDFPPGTGDIQLTIAQTVQMDAAVIVSTPHELSITDVRKGIMMFDKVDVPVMGVIENMAYFLCEQCNAKQYLFGKHDEEHLQQRLGLDTLAEIPLNPQFNDSIQALSASDIAKEATDAMIRAAGRESLVKREPPQIETTESHIHLTWPDGKTDTVGNRTLRLACACALCVDEMSHKPILDEASIPQDIHAESTEVIGNYALGIKWSDGHSTGFFPFKRIRELAAKEQNA